MSLVLLQSGEEIMTFNPNHTMTPRIVRQIVAIERTNGFLNAVRLQADWIDKLRREVQVEDALASVQIEGSSLTLERAFDLAKALDGGSHANLRDSEREFLNYLRSFDAIDALRDSKNEFDYRFQVLQRTACSLTQPVGLG